MEQLLKLFVKMESPRAKENIVFCLMIFLSNLMILAVITTSPRLRRFSKFHIISNISIANIIACLVFFPLDTHEALRIDTSETNPRVNNFLRGIHLYCLPSILAISIVCLSINYMANRVYNTSLRRTTVTSVTSVLVSWTFGLVSLIPFSCWQLASVTFTENNLLVIEEPVTQTYRTINNTYNVSRHGITENDSHKYECIAPVSMITAQILIWGFLPLILALAVTVSSVVLRQIHRAFTSHTNMANINMSADFNEDDHPVELRLLDTVISMLVSLALGIPCLVEAVSDLMCSPTDQCAWPESVSRTTKLARWAVSFILPVLWIADSEFNKALSALCDKLCLGSNVEIHHISVT